MLFGVNNIGLFAKYAHSIKGTWKLNRPSSKTVDFSFGQPITQTALLISGCTSLKVHIFWEGHKILRNLHLTFVLCSWSKLRWRFRTILWLSQNIWNLPKWPMLWRFSEQNCDLAEIRIYMFWEIQIFSLKYSTNIWKSFNIFL